MFLRNWLDLLPFGAGQRFGPGAFGHRTFLRDRNHIGAQEMGCGRCGMNSDWFAVRFFKCWVGLPFANRCWWKSALIHQRLQPSGESHADFLDEVFQFSFFAHAVRQASFKEIHHNAAIQTTPGMTLGLCPIFQVIIVLEGF